MEISFDQLEVFAQLTIALILGAILGLERLIAGKDAGMRTFGIVSIASCLFVIVGNLVAYHHQSVFNFDPLRLASAIVTGIGFLGAGLIIFQHELKGLTTAAVLWAASAIGVAVGFKLYMVATFATFLILFVCVGIWYIEHFLEERIAYERDIRSRSHTRHL